MSRVTFISLLVCLAMSANATPSYGVFGGSQPNGQTVQVQAVAKGGSDTLVIPVRAKIEARSHHRHGWWSHHCRTSRDWDDSHSWHWNYHHGYTNCDGPYDGPYYKRDLTKRGKTARHSKGRHHKGHHGKQRMDQKSHKEDAVDAKAKVHIEKRHSHDHGHRHHGHHGHHSHDWDRDYYRHGWKRADAAAPATSTSDSADKQPSGLPGFIAVATPIEHSAFAHSSGGLVYSADPNGGNTSFLLGTAPDDGNQFNLVPVDANDVNSAVTIRVPILDAKSMTTKDYCATFDTAPPSPLTLESCEAHAGKSQNFAWNAKTGELVPVYAASTKPKTNTAVKDTVQLVAEPNTTSTNAAAAPSAKSNSDSAAPTPGLYFVPSSSYYSQNGTVAMAAMAAPPSSPSPAPAAAPAAASARMLLQALSNAAKEMSMSAMPSASAH